MFNQFFFLKFCINAIYLNTESSSNGQFVFVDILSSNMIHISIIRCPESFHSNELLSTIYSQSGLLNLAYCNISHCYTSNNCIIQYRLAQTFDQNYCSITYNYASSASSNGYYLQSITNSTIQNSNFIHNNVISTLILTNRNLSFVQYIFYYNYYSLFEQAGSFPVSFYNCFISIMSNYSYSIGSSIPISTRNGVTQTIVIEHFSTYYCNKELQGHQIVPCATQPISPIFCYCHTNEGLNYLTTYSAITAIISISMFHALIL